MPGCRRPSVSMGRAGQFKPPVRPDHAGNLPTPATSDARACGFSPTTLLEAANSAAPRGRADTRRSGPSNAPRPEAKPPSADGAADRRSIADARTVDRSGTRTASAGSRPTTPDEDALVATYVVDGAALASSTYFGDATATLDRWLQVSGYPERSPHAGWSSSAPAVSRCFRRVVSNSLQAFVRDASRS